MSYARFSDDLDVYVYKDFDEKIHIHISNQRNYINAPNEKIVSTAKECLDYLIILGSFSYKIPTYTLERLKKEKLEETDPEILYAEEFLTALSSSLGWGDLKAIETLQKGLDKLK